MGNGGEGYKPSMYLPAKTEMPVQVEIGNRKYFLQFNFIYIPDKYIGIWWQFKNKLLTKEQAESFINEVEP